MVYIHDQDETTYAGLPSLSSLASSSYFSSAHQTGPYSLPSSSSAPAPSLSRAAQAVASAISHLLRTIGKPAEKKDLDECKYDDEEEEEEEDYMNSQYSSIFTRDNDKICFNGDDEVVSR
eukprot:TRINITY_DN691_c0_g1_i1.p1 TRINITY_DN691_c0_g1~~TRINITY_DN691_c0_g1_i1.p1  ORF type:complete len:120 (-),score=32.86 TRINITY_DN691_c0_g1_i1:243-602(-)